MIIQILARRVECLLTISRNPRKTSPLNCTAESKVFQMETATIGENANHIVDWTSVAYGELLCQFSGPLGGIDGLKSFFRLNHLHPKAENLKNKNGSGK